jgi:hypothetical protein
MNSQFILQTSEFCIVVILVMIRCSLLLVYQRFRWKYYLHLQGIFLPDCSVSKTQITKRIFSAVKTSKITFTVLYLFNAVQQQQTLGL